MSLQLSFIPISVVVPLSRSLSGGLMKGTEGTRDGKKGGMGVREDEEGPRTFLPERVTFHVRLPSEAERRL